MIAVAQEERSQEISLELHYHMHFHSYFISQKYYMVLIIAKALRTVLYDKRKKCLWTPVMSIILFIGTQTLGCLHLPSSQISLEILI